MQLKVVTNRNRVHWVATNLGVWDGWDSFSFISIKFSTVLKFKKYLGLRNQNLRTISNDNGSIENRFLMSSNTTGKILWPV